jgi:hypothetical protein
MDRTHIYVQSTNFEYIKHIRDDIWFSSCFEYPFLEKNSTHRNEYGRIKTPSNFIHFIMGQLPDRNCPWCSNPAALIKVKESTNIIPAQYCIQCLGCGSRGPILHVSQAMETNPDAFEHVKDMMYQRYSYRNAWDQSDTWKKEFKELQP